MLDDAAPTGKPTGRICHQMVIIGIHAEMHDPYVVCYWTAGDVLEYDLRRHWGGGVAPCSTLLDVLSRMRASHLSNADLQVVGILKQRRK